ncbi:MAG: glycosyltransferase family 4 protein [Draconibacterium sp.]
MKLYFDNIIFSLQAAGGISVVWYELIKRALADNDMDIYFLEDVNKNILRQLLDIPHHRRLGCPLAKLPLKFQRYLNPNIQKAKGIFHSSYYRTANSSNLLNVTTVHDFTYEYYRKGVAKTVHSWQKGNAIKNADKVICVSNNTKSDLLKFYPDTPPEKIEVIYNGVDESYGVLSSCSINQLEKLVPFNSKEYAVFVGDRKSNHKNFRVAVESCKKTDTPLVLIGGGVITEKEKKLFEQTKFKQHEHLSGISNTQLNIIYNNALCLLYPSSYEGFGIPVIEAQKAGCPVVAANNSSISEIAKGSAILIEDIDPESFADKIILLKVAPALVDQLTTNGITNANRFSWDICYQQTKNLYLKMYKENL